MEEKDGQTELATNLAGRQADMQAGKPTGASWKLLTCEVSVVMVVVVGACVLV